MLHALIYVKLLINLYLLKKKYKLYNFILGLLLVFPGFYEWNFYTLLETGLWTFDSAFNLLFINCSLF